MKLFLFVWTIKSVGIVVPERWESRNLGLWSECAEIQVA